MTMAINFVLFQLSWFACVLGGANALPWLGPLAVALFIAYHLTQAPRPTAALGLLDATVAPFGGGPYQLAGIEEDGTYLLEANPKHTRSAPQPMRAGS